jgi:hypothetical protein
MKIIQDPFSTLLTGALTLKTVDPILQLRIFEHGTAKKNKYLLEQLSLRSDLTPEIHSKLLATNIATVVAARIKYMQPVDVTASLKSEKRKTVLCAVAKFDNLEPAAQTILLARPDIAVLEALTANKALSLPVRHLASVALATALSKHHVSKSQNRSGLAALASVYTAGDDMARATVGTWAFALIMRSHSISSNCRTDLAIQYAALLEPLVSEYPGLLSAYTANQDKSRQYSRFPELSAHYNVVLDGIETLANDPLSAQGYNAIHAVLTDLQNIVINGDTNFKNHLGRVISKLNKTSQAPSPSLATALATATDSPAIALILSSRGHFSGSTPTRLKLAEVIALFNNPAFDGGLSLGDLTSYYTIRLALTDCRKPNPEVLAALIPYRHYTDLAIEIIRNSSDPKTVLTDIILSMIKYKDQIPQQILALPYFDPNLLLSLPLKTFRETLPANLAAVLIPVLSQYQDNKEIWDTARTLAVNYVGSLQELIQTASTI